MKVPDRYIRTKADAAAVEQGCYWDWEAGERVVSFFEDRLLLSSGPKAGEPFHLLETQKQDVIYPLYCWRRPDGRRRFTRCLITSGKKNFGKTVMAAGLGLYHLTEDGVESPLVVLGAAAKEQASEVLKQVLYSVWEPGTKCKEPRPAWMETDLKAVESLKYMTYPSRNGMLKAISFDNMGRAKGGWNCSMVVLDEVALHRDASLYEMLK